MTNWRRSWAMAGVAGLAGLICGVSPSAAAVPARDGQLAIQPLAGPGLILASDTGAGTHRICIDTSVCGSPVAPQWSPDGRTLIFIAAPRASAATQPGGAGSVRIIDTDGDCVECQYGSAAAPSFRPGNAGISFIATDRRLGEDDLGGLAVGQRRLPDGASAAVWSSRGALAVAARGRVSVFSSAGHTTVRLIGDAPSWSPDGRSLAVMRGGWIWIVDAQTGRGRRLIRGSVPTFAPDGRRLAFIGSDHRVEVVAVSGGRPRDIGRLRGRSVAWGARPSSPARCLAPRGSRTLADTDGTLLYSVSPHTTQGPLGTAVFSCLPARGVPSLVSTTAAFSSGETQAVLGAVDGDAVAVVGSSSVTSTGFTYTNEYVTLANAATGATGAAVNPGPGSSCPGPGDVDSDVSPASPCGINELVVNPSGVAAVGVTSPTFGSCPSPDTCWTQSVVEDTAGQTRTLAQNTTDGPTGGSGLTNLAIGANAVSWEDDGTPQSATF